MGGEDSLSTTGTAVGACQAEGLYPRSRRAPQESDRADVEMNFRERQFCGQRPTASTMLAHRFRVGPAPYGQNNDGQRIVFLGNPLFLLFFRIGAKIPESTRSARLRPPTAPIPGPIFFLAFTNCGCWGFVCVSTRCSSLLVEAGIESSPQGNPRHREADHRVRAKISNSGQRVTLASNRMVR